MVVVATVTACRLHVDVTSGIDFTGVCVLVTLIHLVNTVCFHKWDERCLLCSAVIGRLAVLLLTVRTHLGESC